MNTSFNYNLCLICQTVQDSPLRCPAHDKNINHRFDIYETFIADWDRFRSASIPIYVCLLLPEASVANLLNTKRNGTENTDICLLCEQQDTEDDILPSFQKVKLTEELKNKALLIIWR